MDPFDPMRPSPCPAGGSCKVICKCPACRLPGARRTAFELEQGIPARNETPDTEALRRKLINALYGEIIHQQPEAVFRGQYGVLEIGEVTINCCALAHEVLRAFKEAAGGVS